MKVTAKGGVIQAGVARKSEELEGLCRRLVPRHATEGEYEALTEGIRRFHSQAVGPQQVRSMVAQRIRAPAGVVWSVVRRFDRPQSYKHFIRSCRMVRGDGRAAGSVREVSVVSGLPASSSTERLELLDDDRHILSFSVLGGEHRLKNYRSTTSLHEFCIRDSDDDDDEDGRHSRPWTLVVESYVVDIPPGNTAEDTSIFVDTVVTCNLHSLAHLSERLAASFEAS